MNWDDARLCDQLAYDMKLADYPRGLNRARIDELANGFPPFTDQEVQENQIAVNFNDLSMTRLCHDARSQFANGILKPGNYFTSRVDTGPKHKRSKWSASRTRRINKVMKQSIKYYEGQRAKFASLVLHGLAPSAWEGKDGWCPRPLAIADALIPSKTLIGFDNLPFFFIYRSFTAHELQRLVFGPKRDPGWNTDLSERCLKWADEQGSKLGATNWPEVWSPEHIQERIKEDTGFYASDQVPTIDTFDIYAYVDDDEKSGWIRRIVLDSWGTPSPAGAGTGYTMSRDANKKTLSPEKDDFLFTSGKNYVADTWQQIAAFQYADLSAVSPFRYHSIRGLGFLLYSVCDLQNRMRCKFNESVFEALMQYFRVKNADDAQQALKVLLTNRGFIDNSVEFVKRDDRWQVDSALAQLGLQQNAELISAHASGFTSSSTNFSQDRTEKTKFQVMAELNAMTSLVSTALAQAYQYQNFEYNEISRRFCNLRSNNADVKSVIAGCLKDGIPEEVLGDPSAWEQEPVRVMGAGNKTLEMAIAQQLMEWRVAFDPEPQREILRDAVLAITDDPARAELLVPESPVKVTDSVHDAQLSAGVLMQGLPVAVKTGVNHIETINTLLATMASIIQGANQSGGMLPPDKINGVKGIAAHIAQHLNILSQDPTQKALVKKYADQLGKLMNFVKAFEQRLMEQMKKQQEAAQQGNGAGVDAETQAKVQGMIIQAQTKAQIQRESHAQRTAQRDIQFQKELQHDQQRHAATIAKTDLEAAADIRRMELENAVAPPKPKESPSSE